MSSLRERPFRIFYSPADDPLNNFYIPALSSSVRYDRSAGFFSSSALAVAAAGVARLIQNGGHMHLMVGADLSEEDVEAIAQGHDLKERLTQRMLERFPDPQDALMKERLAVLAWMIAEGMLEIKVALPRDERGFPLPASVAENYYHVKSGVFTDAKGNQIGFSGSVNESETAWRKNYENFSVYFSWNETAPYLEQHKINFERLWNGKEQDWIALDIPEAIRGQLLKYRPSRPPQFDPLEYGKQKEPIQTVLDQLPGLRTATLQERILFQFLRDAPYLPNAIELGARTSAIQAWPHQLRVARSIIERFPDRALLCDEVGLGKTIEAGLIIRQLLLSERVKRCLILAPKSVLRQWQEELYEKFALEVPRYDSNVFWDVHGQRLETEETNPWNAFDVMLAGSQLAKRLDRRNELLSAKSWDLMVVDEAHHARRKDFLQKIYRPNNLLSLLNDFKADEKYASLLLLTATPMQVHPLEVWDLLSTLGLGGRWGANEEDFLEFFSQLRLSFDQIDWEFMFDMLRDHLESGGKIQESFVKEASAQLGAVKWKILEELPARQGQREQVVASLGKPAQSFVVEMARLHTPMSRYMFRNTRAVLREYERKGILKISVPKRKPEIKRVPMRSDEQTLYDRIDEYISHFYHKYENEKRGLGFVMTVYRRRLTSSFFAVRCSLERRLKYLQGQMGEQDIFTDDDTEQDELDFDQETKSGHDKDYFETELNYVKDFIQELKLLSIADSKLEVLKDQLNQVFHKRSTVLVFTQYTDTMEYLRGQLQDVYGNEIACYSGRGGEVWNGIAWVETSKESVKEDFRLGKVRILLCTDSASEGLNLQTCGVLINYDMPWNPMRVEQRIGRIDRIGQEFPEVWISNYFYKDTIEDQIYFRLRDRIQWFEVVVGDLQPILAEVGEVTRRLAMLSPTEREIELENEIRKLKNRIQERSFDSLNLDQFAQSDINKLGPISPVTLEQIEYILTTSQATATLFTPHPEIEKAYLLQWENASYPVTFSSEVFDQYPVTLRLLTFGTPLLDQILKAIPDIGDEPVFPFVRLSSEKDIKVRQWFIVNGNSALEIPTVQSLQDNLSKLDSSNPVDIQIASQKFENTLQQISGQYEDIIQYRRKAEFLTNKKRAQSILIKAALVEIALGVQADMFDTEAYPTVFNEQTVIGLQRHGFPWGPLLKLAFEDGLSPKEEDPYFQKINSENKASLKARFAELAKEAREIIPLLSNSI
jgi:ERCC4-related helicase